MASSRSENPAPSQIAHAREQSQQAVQQSGNQYNLFVGAAQAQSIASSAPPIVVPQKRVASGQLRGRSSLVDSVTSLLAYNGPNNSPRRDRVVALYGLGGVGKTAVSLEVAHSFIEQGITTWWVSAEDTGSMRAAFHSVAFAAGAHDEDFNHAHPADVLWRHLNASTQPWLLVIDNADEPATLGPPGGRLADGTGWLRVPSRESRGSVLLSTRDSRIDQWSPWTKLVHIEPLGADFGAAVLMDLAFGAGSVEEAEKLATMLGGLPLALELAGRYIASAMTSLIPVEGSLRSFAAYKNSIERSMVEISMAEGSSDSKGDPRRTLSSTWEMSVDLLERQGFSLARPLLRLLACFAPTALPYRVILQPENLATSTLFPNPAPQRISDVLRALAGLGLVSLESAPRAPRTSDVDELWIGTLTMHPLVRSTTQANLRKSSDSNAYLDLLTTVLSRSVSYLDTDNATDWGRWAILAPHCFAPIDLLYTSSDVTKIRRALYPARQAAWYRYMAGLYKQAESDLQGLLSVAESSLGDSDEDVLSVRNNLARCTREAGQGLVAEAMLRTILATAQRSLGSGHELTINTHINLARTMRENGNVALAESEFRTILSKAREALGENHRDMLVAWLNLAVTLRRQRRFGQAEVEYRAVLAAWRRNFPEEDLTTLDIRFELAETMRENGSPGAAVSEYKNLLSVLERVYGLDHPNAITVREGMAAALRAAGDVEGARAELQGVLERSQLRLGQNHPFTQAVASKLAEY